MSKKLYLVSRGKSKSNNKYDSYDSFIVCCKTEQEARETHAVGVFIYDKNKQTWHDSKGEYVKEKYDSWIHGNEINLLEIECLGNANTELEEGVILSSHNSG